MINKIIMLTGIAVSSMAYSGGGTGVIGIVAEPESIEILVQPDEFRVMMREALTTSTVNLDGIPLDVRSTSMLEGSINAFDSETLESLKLVSEKNSE